MRLLWTLILSCYFSTASYGQQTIDVPIILDGHDKGPFAISGADLKVEVGHQSGLVTSITPLANHPLQYMIVNEESNQSLWPKGISQQVDVANQFLNQVITTGDIGGLVNFDHELYFDVKDETDPQSRQQIKEQV